MNSLEDLIEESCKLVDEFSKESFTPGTPVYNFQQSLINQAKIYREAREKQEKEHLEMWKYPNNCHSYIPESKL